MHGWSGAQARRARELWLQRQSGAPERSAEQEAPLEKHEVTVERLSFELLPPGTWDIEHVIRYYQREASRLSADLARREIQWSRLRAIKSLKPTKCYVGTELWLGYVLFEFSHSSCVVLECPVKGNATYVLSGDWKKMVIHTKLYLKTRFPKNCTKVIHKGGWLRRIRAAL
jgi:hypothetical protein